MRIGLAAFAVAVVAAGLASPARADGFPPFYGYSPYLGGPVAYFTPDEDVRVATVVGDGLPGMGTRTYYRGGPFFTYQSVRRQRVYAPRQRSRRAVLVRKG